MIRECPICKVELHNNFCTECFYNLNLTNEENFELAQSLILKFQKEASSQPETALRFFRLLELLPFETFIRLSVPETLELYKYYLKIHKVEPELSQDKSDGLKKACRYLGLKIPEFKAGTETQDNNQTVDSTEKRKGRKGFLKRKITLKEILEKLPVDEDYDGYYDPVEPLDSKIMKTRKARPRQKMQFGLSALVILLSVISVTSFIMPFI